MPVTVNVIDCLLDATGNGVSFSIGNPSGKWNVTLLLLLTPGALLFSALLAWTSRTTPSGACVALLMKSAMVSDNGVTALLAERAGEAVSVAPAQLPGLSSSKSSIIIDRVLVSRTSDPSSILERDRAHSRLSDEVYSSGTFTEPNPTVLGLLDLSDSDFPEPSDLRVISERQKDMPMDRFGFSFRAMRMLSRVGGLWSLKINS
jgi:hypothetical protein